MHNPVPVLRMFEATLNTAVETSQRLASTEPQLVPTIFLITHDAQTIMVAWEAEPPSTPAGKSVMQLLVGKYQPCAMVFVSEIALTVFDENNVPDRMGDGIIVAGYYKSIVGNDMFVCRMWELDGNRKATESDLKGYPSNALDWMPEVMK